MNDTLTKERQQELFEEFSPSSPKRVERIPSLAKSNKPILITTTTEQILLASIVCILILCSVFFIGVLRGKSLQTSVMQDPVNSQRPIDSVRPAAPTRAAMASPLSAAPSSGVVGKGSSTTVAASTSMEAPYSTKPYTIQLVTHRGKQMAETEVSNLRRSGLISFIIPSGEYYQVCVGQFSSKDEAKKKLKSLSGRFKDSFVRRR